MTPGQIAHDAGKFDRQWEHMGESQKADWERIAQAVIQPEQYRILRIVYDKSQAYGKPGECLWIAVKAAVRHWPSVGEACEAQGIALRTEFEPKTDWSAS